MNSLGGGRGDSGSISVSQSFSELSTISGTEWSGIKWSWDEGKHPDGVSATMEDEELPAQLVRMMKSSSAGWWGAVSAEPRRQLPATMSLIPPMGLSVLAGAVGSCGTVATECQDGCGLKCSKLHVDAVISRFFGISVRALDVGGLVCGIKVVKKVVLRKFSKKNTRTDEGKSV